MTVFAEIYDNRSTKQQRLIDTSVTLVSESGQEVFNARDTVTNPSASLEQARAVTVGGRHMGWHAIPLANVPAGR